ncbi:hypothetical protein [Corynebacterium cystitidis]|uniref:Putative ABC transport system permease protein n=1 Tax=Corynebacterium cystitidis DSM 20524 TaxID=1121357 RepID=A0A1H9SGT8_9CORY|nr:hypothetical protein [Corynebacterium cystitidis]WJY83025.1 hypothetical protein CCYS_10615 [Corynebacterium cystitidis DSM 20524]SER83825.1 putative ABC transport system permease protein [Corynebacterium cystitidis DSM 20524]SNV65037.1 ABC transport system, permease [Corynebacterium cystitidis]
MFGIALVTAIGMLRPQTGALPVPADVPDAVCDVEGVDQTVFYARSPVAVDGTYSFQAGPHSLTDVMGGDPAELVDLEMAEGSSDLAGHTLISPRELADEHGWQVGGTVELSAPGISQDTIELTVGGIFQHSSVFPKFIVSYDAATELVPPQANTILMVGVNGDGTVEHEQLRANLEDAVEDHS